MRSIVISLALLILSAVSAATDAESVNGHDILSSIPEDLFKEIVTRDTWNPSKDWSGLNRRFRTRFHRFQVDSLRQQYPRLISQWQLLLHNNRNLSVAVYEDLFSDLVQNQRVELDDFVMESVSSGSPKFFKAIVHLAERFQTDIPLVELLQLNQSEKWSDVVKKVCPLLSEARKLAALDFIAPISFEAVEICFVTIPSNSPVFPFALSILSREAFRHGLEKVMFSSLDKLKQNREIFEAALSSILNSALRSKRFDLAQRLMRKYPRRVFPFQYNLRNLAIEGEQCLSESEFLQFFDRFPNYRHDIHVRRELERCRLHHLVEKSPEEEDLELAFT